MFDRLIRTHDDLSLLLLRLVLAVVIFAHGAQKAFGWFGGYGFEGTVGYFASVGVPSILAVSIIALEVLGPLALVAGFLGRPVAVGIAGIMTGAILIEHAPNGFFMNWSGTQAGEGFEFHLLALAIALAVALRGSGALSLDRRLSR